MLYIRKNIWRVVADNWKKLEAPQVKPNSGCE